MMTALVGVTKPAPGVIVTKPATMPEQKPNTLGLPRTTHSSMPQTKPAVAAARTVVVKAFEARASEPSAEPALKPNQPTKSMPVPIMTRTNECGGIGTLPKPKRGPRIMQRIRALQPEDIWTTVPPAKSMALMPASALSGPHIKPLTAQTMWAKGK